MLRFASVVVRTHLSWFLSASLLHPCSLEVLTVAAGRELVEVVAFTPNDGAPCHRYTHCQRI